MEKRTGTQQSEAGMSRSYVVTGGGRGIGRAVVERLLGDSGTVVAIELDSAALSWIGDHPAGSRVSTADGRWTSAGIVRLAAARWSC